MFYLREATEDEGLMFVNEAHRAGYGWCSPPTHVLVFPNHSEFSYSPMYLYKKDGQIKINHWYPVIHNFPLVSVEVWDEMDNDEQKAYVEIYGIKVCATSSIAETFEYGFGDLNENGFWEYTCKYVPSKK